MCAVCSRRECRVIGVAVSHQVLQGHGNVQRTRISQYHRDAVVASADFTAIMRQIRLSLSQEVQRAVARKVCKNRSILRSVKKTVVFLGKQYILRGHRNDSKWMDLPGHNPGNFQALLDFRLDSGDKELQEHLRSAP